ncbi:MAG: hypothetical protein ACJ8R9_12435 [Steroidobacteraceae bacterium]
MLHSVPISQGDVWDIRWNEARRASVARVLLLGLFRNSGRRRRWGRINDALSARDPGQVRGKESRRASQTDYRDG